MNEVNKYLEKAQEYLSDLDISNSAKILSEMTSELNENLELLTQDTLSYVNSKRVQHGHREFVLKPKKSFGKFLLKGFGFFMLLICLGFGFLYWKFTPLYEIDEENGRITLLGGFIEANYNNDFQASFAGSAKNFVIKFNSGKFDLNPTTESTFKLDCKLSQPPLENMIKNNVSSITIDFSELDGSTCSLSIPRDTNLRIQGDAGKLVITYPNFHLDAKLTAGNIIFTPDENLTYNYNINVENGYRANFKSESLIGDEYEVRINIKNGSVHKNN